ncbi:hypothetical protein FNV43_RR03090 [Rhamnella rubrinervis]|uniref:SOSEKI DIX-like domain-containing protein n=1 Tax=Rhamnella rubrinervis TaxID=2594499 RepID=A0A8K0HH28_9ROSA|nr:hypothetical protein FNV43_RR03090 [Rhamnella rubrinervis]
MEAKLGGGEIRRLHIIYFLSHMGRVDHPHLIRVHHLTRSGVYLRDVKRWLAELRGKDIAEAYAWSYKRRYKKGYVWQDLLDDDLITPISDNEYVLKGSEIISATYDGPTNQYVEKKGSTQKEEQLFHEVVEDHKLDDQPPPPPPQLLKQEIETYPDSKRSSEINQESPHFGSERSTLTDVELSDESMKLEDQEDNNKHSSETVLTNNNVTDCGNPKEKFGSIPSAFYSNRGMNKKETTSKKNLEEGTKEMEGTPPNSSNSSSSTSSSSKSSALPKSKSYSSGASSVLRNLMSCGAVDTNDAVLVMFSRRDHHKSSSATTKRSSNESSRIFKGDKLGGSARCFGTTFWNPHDQEQQQQQQQKHSPSKSCEWSKESYHSKKHQQQQQTEFTNQKPVSAAYRPVREPNCSQCGKPFKPEKMHSHMKSCKGMKALAKATPTSINRTPINSDASMTSSYNNSASSGYLLTN